MAITKVPSNEWNKKKIKYPYLVKFTALDIGTDYSDEQKYILKYWRYDRAYRVETAKKIANKIMTYTNGYGISAEVNYNTEVISVYCLDIDWLIESKLRGDNWLAGQLISTLEQDTNETTTKASKRIRQYGPVAHGKKAWIHSHVRHSYAG